MEKLSVSRFFQMVVLLTICAASALVGFALRVDREISQPLFLQQSDEKVIERKEYGFEPFEFGNLSVKKTKVALRQKFNARALAESSGEQVEDWLENLEFTIKNKSDKTITYIDLDITFPETGVDRPMMVYDLDVGIHPTAFGDALKYGKPLALNPGDTFTFTLSAKTLGMIQKFLALGGFQLANLNKATIRIDTIFFEDETKWDQGDLYKLIPGEKLVPGRPPKYERINK